MKIRENSNVKLVTCMIFFALFSLQVSAHDLDVSLNYYHLRTESSQTGQPSEFLFLPSPQLALDYHYDLTKNQAVGVGIDYSLLELDTSNISLNVNEDEFDPFNYYLKYSIWYKGGLNFTVNAGQKMFALYEIQGLGVTFDRFFPPYAGAAIAFRAKNILGTVEFEYNYKHVIETETNNLAFTGFIQELKGHINFGRRTYSGQTRKGPFSKIFYTYYRTPAFEGNWGIFFKYIFSSLESEDFEYKTDERVFGIYYKWRIIKRFKRN